jgi:hypothetical protein
MCCFWILFVCAQAKSGATVEYREQVRVQVVEGADKEMIRQERHFMEDLLNNLIIVLDILVYRTLSKNPELVYNILHQQTMLLQIAGEPERGKHLRNVDKVVQHFSTCVDTARQSWSRVDEWSVGQVMGVIQHELLSWRKSHLCDVEDMHCTYEESPRACDFFLPYVWSTIIESTSSQYFPLPSTSLACNGDLGSNKGPTIA